MKYLFCIKDIATEILFVLRLLLCSSGWTETHSVDKLASTCLQLVYLCMPLSSECLDHSATEFLTVPHVAYTWPLEAIKPLPGGQDTSEI